jgi:rRNA biogenesis protein RRP5
MPAQKRSQDDPSQSIRKSKKSKPNDSAGSKGQENTRSNGDAPSHVSKLISEEVDFPRGGGTSFTPLEVRNLRAEAAQEADQELFKV